MSITINYGTSIHKFEQAPCICEGKDGDCHFCKGEGVEMVNVLEMNMANCNFSTVMSALGVKIDMNNGGSGDIFPVELIKRIDSYQPGLGERQTVENGNMLFCGIDGDYVTRRLTILRNIAQAYIDAGKGDVPIPWG